MTAKTYTQLVDQANVTLADNIARDISAADVRAMHVDHLDSQNAGTILVVTEQGTPLPAAGAAGRLFFETIVSALHVDDGTSFLPVVMSFNSRPGPAILPVANDYSLNLLSDATLTAPVTDDILVFNGAIFVNQARRWLEDVNNDWVPKTTGQGIGSANASPAFVTVGSVATAGLEGLIGQRLDTDGGGIRILGFRGDPSDGIEPNAPVEMTGSSVLIDGTLFLGVASAVLEDHFLITKPSITLPDGRLVVPLVLGPVHSPTTSENATDARDVDITPAATEVEIIGPVETNELVLANQYDAGSTVNVALVIEEIQGNTALATVTIKLDTGGGPIEIFSDTISLQGNRQNYFMSQPTTVVLEIGDILSVFVDYINGGGGGAREVHVRGDVVTSTIEIQEV